MERIFSLGLATLVLATICHAVPNKFDGTGGFQPSSRNMFHQNGDQVAMETSQSSDSVERRSGEAPPNELSSNQARPKEPKFGFVFPGMGLQPGASNSVYPGYSGQLNLDVGGLILGAAVGLGAVFILPKIIHLFSGHHGEGYGHYKRSEDDTSELGIMQLLTKVDNTLAQYNVDSTSCVQRAICSYVKASASKVAEGKANNFDSIVNIVSSNSLMSFMLDGSSIKKAVDRGRNGENCGVAYPKCPFNKDSVYAAVKGLIGDQFIKE